MEVRRRYVNTSLFQFSFSVFLQYSITIIAVDMKELEDITDIASTCLISRRKAQEV